MTILLKNVFFVFKIINNYIVILKILLKGQRVNILKSYRNSHNALYIFPFRLGLLGDILNDINAFIPATMNIVK